MRSARFIIRPAHSRVARRRRPSVFRPTRQGETPCAMSPNCPGGSSATSRCFSRTLIGGPFKSLPHCFCRVNPKMTDRPPRAAVGLIKQTENKVLRLDEGSNWSPDALRIAPILLRARRASLTWSIRRPAAPSLCRSGPRTALTRSLSSFGNCPLNSGQARTMQSYSFCSARFKLIPGERLESFVKSSLSSCLPAAMRSC